MKSSISKLSRIQNSIEQDGQADIQMYSQRDIQPNAGQFGGYQVAQLSADVIIELKFNKTYWIIFRNCRRVHHFILGRYYIMIPLVFDPHPTLFSGCVLLYLRSPKAGCCSISDGLSCSIESLSLVDRFAFSGRKSSWMHGRYNNMVHWWRGGDLQRSGPQICWRQVCRGWRGHTLYWWLRAPKVNK